MLSMVAESDPHVIERHTLPVRSHPNGHRRARSEGSEKMRIGVRAEVGAAHVQRLIRNPLVRGGAHPSRKLAVALVHNNLARLDRGGVRRDPELVGEPARYRRRDELGVRFVREEMITFVEADEALRVPRRLEDRLGLIDPYGLIERRVEDQQRAAQRSDVARVDGAHIVEEVAPNLDRSRANLHLGRTVLCNGGGRIAKKMRHVGRIERRANRHHGARRADVRRRLEYRRTAQAVADQHVGSTHRVGEESGRGDEVRRVRTEYRRFELPLARAEPGKVEAQRCDPARRKKPCYPHTRCDVFAAGKAMCEECNCAGRTVRQFEHPREFARRARKPHRLLGHLSAPVLLCC